MRVVGKFLTSEAGSYQSKTGQTVQQIEVTVLSEEIELVPVRAFGDAAAALARQVGKLQPMDPVELAVSQPREFRGVLQWTWVAPPS